MQHIGSGRVGARAALLAAALLLALGACSGGPQPRAQRGPPLPPVAQPGHVAAADIAFARAVRDTGGPAAFRSFAASGAVYHAAGGPIPATAWLAAPPDGDEAVDWRVREVWSSCDGSVAVSSGLTRTAGGLVGTYVTAWQRQRDGSYAWTYHASVLDDPQPPPRPSLPEVPEGEDVILVPGFNAIQGRTADCARTLASAAVPEPGMETGTAVTETALSDDRTLRWRGELRPDGGGRLVVDYLREGIWEEAVAYAIPAATAS